MMHYLMHLKHHIYNILQNTEIRQRLNGLSTVILCLISNESSFQTRTQTR